MHSASVDVFLETVRPTKPVKANAPREARTPDLEVNGLTL